MKTTDIREMISIPDADPADHAAKINQISAKYDLNIKFVEFHSRYTRCFAYAFALNDMELAEYFKTNKYAPQDFASKIYNSDDIVKFKEHQAKPGDIVFYIGSSGLISHAGIYLGSGRVRSKWGVNPVYDHDVHRVPTVYGEECLYIRDLGGDNWCALFKELWVI